MEVDKQIYNSIRCKCGKSAIIFFGNVPVCGDCAIKLNEYNTNVVLNRLEEINK